MGVAFASSALLVTSKLIESKQLQQKALIIQLLHSNLTDNAKILSKQLRASVDFEHLTITDTNNNVLYRYIKDPKLRPAVSYLLKRFGLYTPVQRVTTNQGKLVLEFQSSYSQILMPLTAIVLTALLAPMMMMLLIYLIAEYVQDKRLEKIAALLEKELFGGGKKQVVIKTDKLEHFLPLIEKLKHKNNSTVKDTDKNNK